MQILSLRVGSRASVYEYRGGHKLSVSNSNIYDDARPWAGPCRGVTKQILSPILLGNLCSNRRDSTKHMGGEQVTKDGYSE